MTLQATIEPLDAATISRLGDERAEPDWLRDLRRTWWKRAELAGWPTGAEEEWRRTSLAEMPRDGALLTDPPAVEYRLDETAAKAGAIFTDLGTAVREHPELVRANLGTRETLPVQAGIWARSLAGWTGGSFVYVPVGVAVDEVLTIRSELPAGGHSYLPHTLIVAERGASLTVLEEFSSPDGAASWYGGTTEVIAGEGSNVRYASLQRLGNAVWRIGAQRVEVGRDATVTTLDAEIGSAVTKVGLDVQMTGIGGTSRLLGLLAAGEAQHIDINSLQDLAASHTTSDLLYLSALYDESRAAFYGVTKVRPEAKGTSSYQECRNLLLSPKAGAEPIPVLEIETNDILRCGHGATAGAIDPVQRFYAMSRGLTEGEAERMIVRGFFEQVLAQFHSEAVRTRVIGALAPRIGVDPFAVGAA
jgi:Fe-S cluster assembly protein SufD